MDDNKPSVPEVPVQSLAEVLFELGKLRVYHIVTEETMDSMPTKVFWCDLRSTRTYGPFNSIWKAMEHYRWMAEGNQTPVPDTRPTATTIHYDFNRRERITFPIPGEKDEVSKG